VTALSVVLPTRDRPELLRDALASLAVAVRAGDEIIVVDSASRDARVRAVVEDAGLTYVRCDEPGASRARNAGWRRATNDVVAFLDDDIRVAPDWLDRIDAVLSGDPSLAFVTGRVLEPPDDTPSKRAVAIKDDPMPCALRRFTDGPLGQTANTAVRRRALERIGGFDEQLGPGGARGAIAEDVDQYDRLLGAGLEGRYDPSITVFHVQWRAPSQLVGLDWRYGVGSGYRVAKVLRLDRPRARMVARAAFWEWGLVELVNAVRRRWKSVAVYSGVRLAGMCVGFVRGMLTPIQGGHLVARRQ
jgi:glycosyltransferase involved in cell wall biosynthesis